MNKQKTANSIRIKGEFHVFFFIFVQMFCCFKIANGTVQNVYHFRKEVQSSCVLQASAMWASLISATRFEKEKLLRKREKTINRHTFFIRMLCVAVNRFWLENAFSVSLIQNSNLEQFNFAWIVVVVCCLFSMREC